MSAMGRIEVSASPPIRFGHEFQSRTLGVSPYHPANDDPSEEIRKPCLHQEGIGP
jgi:hypothetical protein